MKGNNLKYSLLITSANDLRLSSDYFRASSGMHFFGQPFSSQGPFHLIVRNKGDSPISGRLVLVAD